jgi:hypothetical protein
MFNFLSLSRISLFRLVLNFCPFHMLIYCEDDLGFMCKLPPEITPNTSSPWTIGTLSCGIYIYIFIYHFYFAYYF